MIVVGLTNPIKVYPFDCILVNVPAAIFYFNFEFDYIFQISLFVDTVTEPPQLHNFKGYSLAEREGIGFFKLHKISVYWLMTFLFLRKTVVLIFNIYFIFYFTKFKEFRC